MNSAQLVRKVVPTFRVELVLSDFGKHNLRAAPDDRSTELKTALRYLRSVHAPVFTS